MRILLKKESELFVLLMKLIKDLMKLIQIELQNLSLIAVWHKPLGLWKLLMYINFMLVVTFFMIMV